MYTHAYVYIRKFTTDQNYVDQMEDTDHLRKYEKNEDPTMGRKFQNESTTLLIFFFTIYTGKYRREHYTLCLVVNPKFPGILSFERIGELTRYVRSTSWDTITLKYSQLSTPQNSESSYISKTIPLGPVFVVS